jgi:hypothetical protein
LHTRFFFNLLKSHTALFSSKLSALSTEFHLYTFLSFMRIFDRAMATTPSKGVRYCDTFHISNFGCGRGGVRECLAVIRRCAPPLLQSGRCLQKKYRGDEVDERVDGNALVEQAPPPQKRGKYVSLNPLRQSTPDKAILS